MNNVPVSDMMPDNHSPDMNSPNMPFWQGIEQFNGGEFYACHDTIEALWMVANEPDRTFYQGILQVAVALHHLSNLNWRGAAILLGEGLNRLTKYDDHYSGIDVDRFITQVADVLHFLQVMGPERVEVAAIYLGLRSGPIADPIAPPDSMPAIVLPKITAWAQAPMTHPAPGFRA
ncbi:MAG TPA: DUF309 domain-containing protein [Coleofasciculaceae cyanobacterium]